MQALTSEHLGHKLVMSNKKPVTSSSLVNLDLCGEEKSWKGEKTAHYLDREDSQKDKEAARLWGQRPHYHLLEIIRKRAFIFESYLPPAINNGQGVNMLEEMLRYDTKLFSLQKCQTA